MLKPAAAGRASHRSTQVRIRSQIVSAVRTLSNEGHETEYAVWKRISVQITATDPLVIKIAQFSRFAKGSGCH